MSQRVLVVSALLWAASAATAVTPISFIENWETYTVGSPPGSPWYVDSHMADGGLMISTGTDYSYPYTGGSKGLMVNFPGFNGKDAGVQARLVPTGMEVKATDASRLVVDYYAKGGDAKYAEYYVELSLGDVHAPRLQDVGTNNPLPSPIPVVAYCKPYLDPHHTMFYFDGQKWIGFGALDWDLVWQRIFFRVGTTATYINCGCNNNPFDIPRMYLGNFDRLSIYTRDFVDSSYTVLDELRVTGGDAVYTLNVSPNDGLTTIGPIGGPFSPACKTYTLTNIGASALDWTADKSQSWLDVAPASGVLAGGASVSVDVCLNAGADTLALGLHTDPLAFTDVTHARSQPRNVELYVGQIDSFTESFTTTNDLDHLSLTLTPDASPHSYHACTVPADQFPTNPQTGVVLALSGDNFVKVTLQQGAQVSLYGTAYSDLYIGANGYITFDSGDTLAAGTPANHFQKRRISALFADLAPQANQVTWKQLMDRVAITYQNVAEASVSGSNSFQIEMFYDGRIRLTWLDLSAVGGLAGLSKGQGTPVNFHASDLSAYAVCPAARHPADFDGDGDVDQSDFGHLQGCLISQPVLTLDPFCADADLSMDGNVGPLDGPFFWPCLTGSNLSPTAGCLTGP